MRRKFWECLVLAHFVLERVESFACCRFDRCIGTMISLMPPAFCCIVLLLVFFVGHVESTRCPHCHGNFASCNWETLTGSSKICPSVSVVSTNAASMAAGAGAIVVSALIKPRFLRAFTKATLESLVSLIKMECHRCHVVALARIRSPPMDLQVHQDDQRHALDHEFICSRCLIGFVLSFGPYKCS